MLLDSKSPDSRSPQSFEKVSELLSTKVKVISIKKAKPRLRVLFATGTPVSESPGTAWPLLEILSPNQITGHRKFTNYFEIKRKVVRTKGKGRAVSFTEVVDYTNLEYLKSLLSRYMIRRLRTEVSGMPEVSFIKREVFLSEKARRQYGEMRDVLLSELAALGQKLNLDNAMVKTLRLRQFLEHPGCLQLDTPSPKFDELDLVLEEVLSNPEAKAVVWCNFIPAIRALEARYERWSAIGLSEATSNEELAVLSNQFDTNPCRVILATPTKAGTGVDFLSRARTAVYLGRPYSFIDSTQSLNRIIRRTAVTPATQIERIKASPATVVFLHAPSTVDDLVEAALLRKAKLVQASSNPETLTLSELEGLI